MFVKVLYVLDLILTLIVKIMNNVCSMIALSEFEFFHNYA